MVRLQGDVPGAGVVIVGPLIRAFPRDIWHGETEAVANIESNASVPPPWNFRMRNHETSYAVRAEAFFS